jgi:hypothetical protein
MKKIYKMGVALLLPTLMMSCFKEKIQHEYPVGALVQLHNITIPGVVPPITIDSIYFRTEKVTSYYVHDSNSRPLKNLADYQMKPWNAVK